MKLFDEAPQALRSQGKDSPPVSASIESPSCYALTDTLDYRYNRGNKNNFMRNQVIRKAPGEIFHSGQNSRGLFEKMEQQRTTFIFDMPMYMPCGMLKVSHRSSLPSASIFIMFT
jgi:hypothetical protein